MILPEETPADQVFSLKAQDGPRLLWHFIVNGTVHGPFFSMSQAYIEMQIEQKNVYKQKGQQVIA